MRSDNSGRRERTRPGFLVCVCVRQSSVRGCHFSFVFLYFIIKMCYMFAGPPASFFPYLSTSLQTSHPKGGAFSSIVSPSLYWSIRTHTDHRVSTPAGLTNTSSSSNPVFPGGLPSSYWPAQPCIASVGNRSWAAGWYGCRLIADNYRSKVWGLNVFGRILFWWPELHLFKQKHSTNSNTVNYYYNLK